MKARDMMMVYGISAFVGTAKRIKGFVAMLLLFSFFVFQPLVSRATVTISSVSPTGSTCVNNGSVYVWAYSIPSSSLLYAIVAGPMTVPIQSNPYFPSLFPGSYTVRVYDNNFDSTETQFIITGNYQTPSLQPIATNLTCPNSSDGKIVGNIDSTTGLAPYTWEIISPGYMVPTNGDTFPNLYGGAYDLRVTDACGNYQTRTVTLSGRGTDLGYWQNQYYTFPSVTKIGCDTIAFYMWFTMNKDARYNPLKLHINTWDTSYVKPFYAEVFDSVNFSPAWMSVTETIPNMTYGDYLNVCITDTCGMQVCSYFNQIAPFSFHLEYFNAAAGCNTNIGANVYINSSPFYNFDYTYIKAPAKLTFRDVATNTIIFRDSCSQYCSFVIPPQVVGRNYELTITDGCGDVFQQTYLWPSPLPPAVQPSTGVGCTDSTAIAYMNCQNFMSMLKVELLTGPLYAHSTKPGYQYSDTIHYPVVFNNIQPGGLGITNLPAGTYQYRVSDSCGHVVTGTLVIQPNQLANLHYSYSIKRGCLGNNTLYYDPRSDITVASLISDAATGNQIQLRANGSYGYDSITNAQPGKYVITIWYGTSPYGGGGGFYSVTPNHDCWKLEDTITVYPYDNSTFRSNTTITCNGTTYVQLNVDSSKGVPPYQYEIMSGPQTFPLQDSGLFQLNTIGTYVIRIKDACANSNIQQITIDTAAIAPIVKKGILCVGSKVTLASASSPYFTYDWRRPNGTHYVGDTLTINPFAIRDTGVYTITKYVHINGCIDTLVGTYHITTKDSFPQAVTLCSGSSLQVGNKFYTQTGTYRDTLRSAMGCDSVVISKLTIIQQTNTIVDTTICLGQQIMVGNHIYTQPGTYHDSLAVASCYQLVTTKITVNGVADTVNVTMCNGDTLRVGSHAYTAAGTYHDTLRSYLGCDSIIMTNLTVNFPNSFQQITMCQGDSMVVNGHAYYTAGLYNDTATTSSGCDSLILTIITVRPVGRDTIDAQVCSGGSYAFGGNTYTLAGTYYDTIPTVNCDSIVTLNLTYSNYLRDTLAQSICPGASYVFHGNTYSTAGYYNDTVTGPTCDSIITLHLTAAPYLTAAINASICTGYGYNFYGTVYTQAGIYSDTVSGINCDTVITLNLTMAPYLTKNINAAICAGRSYSFYGIVYTQAGIYSDTVAGVNCDTIVTLQLAMAPYLTKNVNASVCTGRSYNFYGNVYTQPGIYTDTVAGVNCDTVITLQLATATYKRDTLNLAICTGQSTTIGTHTYNQTGTYIDTISTTACDSIVTLNLTVSSYLRDTVYHSLCNGQTITVGTHTYSQSGIYRDTVATATCDKIILLNLTRIPSISSNINDSICEGKSYNLNGTLITAAGVYTARYTASNGCDSTVTVHLSIMPAPDVQIGASAHQVHVGDTVHFSATSTQTLYYHWLGSLFNDNSSQNPFTIFNEPTWIYLTATAPNTCSVLDSLYLDLKKDTINCDSSGIYAPNAFSPNGDNANDVFKLFGVNVTLDKFEVYNRWGELVFQTKDINEGWDGHYKGELMPPDVYVYLISYTTCAEPGPLKYLKGSVTIFR